MRKWIFWGFLGLGIAVVYSQSSNVNLLGRWGVGPSNAIHRRGVYTFVGNGATIEVYVNKRGTYSRTDAVLLDGVVRDIWTRGDLGFIYVACGEAGISVLKFDKTNGDILGVVSSYNTPGIASGISQWYQYVYVADGSQGLHILYLEDPERSQPQLRSTYQTKGFAHDVWVVNDSTVLVAADTSGLIAVKTKDPLHPVFMDSIRVASAFTGFSVPAPRVYHVVTRDTLAYVSAGWGGLRIISIKNPNYLKPLGTWTYGIPVEVRSAWIDGNFVHLACGKDGLFASINVSDPYHPTGPPFENLHTGGYTEDIVVENDTAFVADGFGGHHIVQIQEGIAPSILNTFSMGDMAYDALFSGDYVYVADGRAGVKIFDTRITNPPVERLALAGSFASTGEARRLKKSGSMLCVAEGSYGMSMWNLSNPVAPTRIGEFPTEGDTCYQVDVAGSYAFLASGKDGLRVVDISGSIFEVPGSPIRMRSRVRTLQVVSSYVYVGDSAGVYVYQIGEGGAVTRVDSLPSSGISLDVRALEVSGDTVFVANGKFGLLLWRRSNDALMIKNIEGVCTDLAVREKTIYVSDRARGFRIFDLSTPGECNEVGYYTTKSALGVAVSSGKVGLCDGAYGFYLFESNIRPRIVLSSSSLQFGPVPPNYSRTLTLLVMNQGTSLLKVTNVQANLSSFKFSATSFQVAAGDTYRLAVRFEPTTLTWPFQQLGSAQISSNDPENPILSLTLQGEVSALVTEGPYTPDAFTVGLWHFDEADGVTTITDASGNTLHGQVNGNPRREDSSRPGYGRQMVFDKVDDFVQIPANPLLNLWNTPFTVEIWFSMLSKPQTQYVLIKKGNENTQQFELSLSAEKGLVGRVWDASGTMHTVASGSIEIFNTQQWYHAALTWNLDTLKLYLNGVLKEKKYVPSPLRFQSTESVVVGATSLGGSLFHGTLDEMRISHIAREPWEFHVVRSRIATNFNELQFGNVLVNRKRTLPLEISNVGTQPLFIQGIQANNLHVTVQPSTQFILEGGQKNTVWVTFAPVGEEELGKGSVLLIQSNDPTYPVYSIPLRGFGVTSLPAGPYSSDAFTFGLWHLDETSGIQVIDASGNGMNGTLSGNVFHELELRKFESGASLRFDGTNGRARIPVSSEHRFFPQWGGFTLETWFYLRGLPMGKGTLLARGTSSLRQFELYVDSTATLVGRVYNESQQVVGVDSKSMGTLQVKQWYHAALVLDRDTLWLYVNGNLVSRNPMQGRLIGTLSSPVLDTLSLWIGSNQENTTPFYGYLDEVRISLIGRQSWEFNVNLARLVLSPSQLEFGNVVVGKSRTLYLTFQNPGIDTLIVSDIFSDHPSIFYPDTSRVRVGPGRMARVGVRFKPSTLGLASGKLTFRSNDPFWSVRTLNMEGNGIQSFPVTAYASDIFTSALFHFDTLKDTTASDSSQFKLRAILEGNVVRSDSGRYGSSFRFQNGGISIPFHPVLQLSDSLFTIEFWFMLSRAPSSTAILLKQGHGDTTTLELDFNPSANEGVVAKVWDTQGEITLLRTGTTPPFQIRRWYHVALAYDGDSLRLYLNNQQKDKKGFFRTLRKLVQPQIKMGWGFNKEQPFFGYLDEFRISKIPREQWEIHVSPPTLYVYPGTLHFPTILVQESREMRCWVQNTGDRDLSVTSISISGPSTFLLPDTAKWPFTLSPFQSRMIPVIYKPLVANVTETASMTFRSNDPVHPELTILLEGSGTEAKRRGPYSTDSYTVALYHFDETAGDTVHDASGKRHHGILKGTPRWSSKTGYFKGALRFDGKTNYVLIPASSDLKFDYASESFTIECIFRTDTVSQALLALGYEDSTHSINYGLFIDGEGRLTVPKLGVSGSRYADGAWHHTAFVWNHFIKTGRLYVDGVLVWSKLFTAFPFKKTGAYLILGAAEKDSALFGQYFQGYLDELRISNVIREDWEFPVLEYGIAIQSMTPDPPQYNKPLTLMVYVPSGLNVQQLQLYYRKGGEIHYQTINGEKQSNSLFKVQVPAEAMTLQGFEYYIQAITPKDTITYPTMDPVNNPQGLSVRFSGIEAPIAFYHKQFRMFSIPFQLDTTTVKGVFEDDWGGYDPYQWRLFWWHRVQKRYVDYRDGSGDSQAYFDLVPGRAYWMVTYLEKHFDVGRGRTVPTDSAFVLSIDPGWNMIGNPFNFTVSWDECAVSSDSVSAPYNPEQNNAPNWKLLEPWKGYWVYNASLKEEKILVLPRTQGLKKSLRPWENLTESLDPNEWVIQISAMSKLYSDPYNFIGVKKGASNGWDKWDRPDPPPVENSLTLGVDHSDWEQHGGVYAIDIRNSEGSGHVWQIFVEHPQGGEEVTLNWQWFGTLPEGWKAFLFDLSEGTSIDPQTVAHKTISFKKGSPGLRAFKLVAGTEAFVRSEAEGIPLEPVVFHLYQNYPNPFNPSTVIHYSIPQNGKVSLVIYNTLGQKVRTLVHSEQKTGHYEIEWDGQDDRGIPVASGIYVYRLEIGEKVASRKMILVR